MDPCISRNNQQYAIL